MNLLPLSEFQYSIWKGQKMYPDSPLYNMVFTFDIYGSIDKDRFFQSFGLLVKHTTSLNLVIDDMNEDHPTHKMVDNIPRLEFIDETIDSSFNYEWWLNKMNQLNFNLEESSYFSALIKKAENHYVWYINQHHIFTDAYCFQLLFNRLSTIYGSLGTDSLPPTIESDKEIYIDSCKAKEYNPKVTKDQNQIKRNRLSLYGTELINQAKTESVRTSFTLEKEVLSTINTKLSAFGLKTISSNLDMLTFIMSGLMITFKKVGEHNDSILLSNIFSKRFSKKNKTLVKPLLNILNTEIDWNEEDGYVDLHQKIYALLIMRKEAIEDSENILPSIIVNFFDLRFEKFANYDVKYLWNHCGHMDSHHDLRFHIFRYTADDPFTFAVDVKGGDESSIIGQKLAQDFKKVIHDLLKDLNSINNICLLSNEELTALNTQAEKVSNQTIGQNHLFINIFKDKASSNPNKVALHDLNGQVSYEELLKRSEKLSTVIQSLTKKSGSKVAIYLPRSADFMYAVLASLLQGGSFIPIPYEFPIDRVKYIMQDAGADIIIGIDENIDFKIPFINASAIDYSIREDFNGSTNTTGEEFYTLYTSGSSGKPKGVPISQASFSSYLKVASNYYLEGGQPFHMPLFTSVGFDLTMTSLFLPLATGGSITIYSEKEGIDTSITEVVDNNRLNSFKCTPSHLKLIQGLNISETIVSVIVGGENFTRKSANSLFKQSGNKLSIYNEYGPTECTVGCIVYKYDPIAYLDLADVPIGLPMADCQAFIADINGNPLPRGVIGELCLISPGLSSGYINDLLLTNEKYISDNTLIQSRYYKTGDLARINDDNIFEYLGRTDAQIKMQGIRIETGEIENVIEGLDTVTSCIVAKRNPSQTKVTSDYIHCTKCGLPSNYPTADFDEHHVCGFCRNYETYEKKVEKYFETEQRFEEIIAETKPHNGEYDCMMLFSGGKDSSYALGRLKAYGYKVLAFTLDNGYISENAKDNIKRITKVLGVDHIFGSTPHMNEIFVDSLKTHCNVCNGCFKTIYNLSLKIAFEKNIPIVVTGLSRGQFFETKLSEEIFWKPMDDVTEIDQTLFDARKAYHAVKDIAYEKTDGEFIEENNVLQSVKIVDFYRYHDVTLEDLYTYIENELPWIRPGDTGRSTNCLINKVGIYIHRQERGYSNYAFPYSWDVRTGHKTKEETIDEVEEIITKNDVRQIIEEIGYEPEVSEDQLVVYYTGQIQSSYDFRNHIAAYLPHYMIPSKFIHVEQIPLTTNGKVDYSKLDEVEVNRTEPIIKPTNELEELLLGIYQEVMLLDEISIDDNYFEIGGTSLHAIRIVARIEKSIEYSLGVHQIFQLPSIQLVSQYIIKDMEAILESNSE